LNISKINIYDENNNSLTSNATATSGSTLGNNSASKLLSSNNNEYAHTAGGSDKSKQWFKIDLKSDKKISKVIIKNRTDCCQARINGAQLVISKSNGEVTFNGPIIGGAKASSKEWTYNP
jgi:hypothetical protein